jgi:hypothetical protein
LLVLHGLCISLNAPVQIIEFQLLFYLSVRHKTSLDEIVTLELDTSETTTILSLSIPLNDFCANHIFDEGRNRIRGISEEILCFVKFQVTGLAKSAIRTFMASTIDELVFTFLLASTSFANFKTANFFIDSRSSCFYPLAFNHCHNTRNLTWSIMVGLRVVNQRTSLRIFVKGIFLKLYRVLDTGINVLWEVFGGKTA